MGNWKARGVGLMVVTVGWEDVTGGTPSSRTVRHKCEFGYVNHGSENDLGRDSDDISEEG